MPMMRQRLEGLLVAIATRFAPQVAPQNWRQYGDLAMPLSEYAGVLAKHDLLIMMGDIEAGNPDESIKMWVDSYVELYKALALSLFPSLVWVKAFYADHEQPSVVVIQGTAAPVIEVLANYVTPFVAVRRGQNVQEIELIGLMDMILDYLEARDLASEEYWQLRNEGVRLLQRIITAPVGQRLLTGPASKLEHLVESTSSTGGVIPDELLFLDDEAATSSMFQTTQPPAATEHPKPPDLPPEIDRVPEQPQKNEPASPPPESTPEPATEPDSEPLPANPVIKRRGSGNSGSLPPIPLPPDKRRGE